MNITLEQFEPTGQVIETTQYRLQATLIWKDDEHNHFHSEVILFPDILEQIP